MTTLFPIAFESVDPSSVELRSSADRVDLAAIITDPYHATADFIVYVARYALYLTTAAAAAELGLAPGSIHIEASELYFDEADSDDVYELLCRPASEEAVEVTVDSDSDSGSVTISNYNPQPAL